ADNPAPVGFPFAPDLPGTAAFPHGMEQFNPVAIDYAQDRGSRQKLLRPGAVGRKEPKEAGPARRPGEKAAPAARDPTIERASTNAFEGKEDSQGHHLTGPQTGLAVFCHTPHRLIYPVEQFADKVLRSHAAPPFRCLGVATRSLGSPHGTFQEPLKLAPFVTRGNVSA